MLTQTNRRAHKRLSCLHGPCVLTQTKRRAHERLTLSSVGSLNSCAITAKLPRRQCFLPHTPIIHRNSLKSKTRTDASVRANDTSKMALRAVVFHLRHSLRLSDNSQVISHSRIGLFFVFIILTTCSLRSSQQHIDYTATWTTVELASGLFASNKRCAPRGWKADRGKKTRHATQHSTTASQRGDLHAALAPPLLERIERLALAVPQRVLSCPLCSRS